MANPVILVEYNPKWPEIFQVLRQRIAAKLGPMVATIEHVGSTSVPGLAAKPIIDMDVLLTADSSLTKVIELLAHLEYRYEGDLGIAGREAFKAPKGDLPHHLYVCPAGSKEFERHLAFRNYLRANPIEAESYGALKMSLAIKFREDRDAYCAGKSDFVNRLTNHALLSNKTIR